MRLREVLPKGLFPTGAGDISSALRGRTLVFRNSRDVLLKSNKLVAAHKPPSDALLTGAPFALYGNENDHAEPHKVTRNRACRAWFAEARKGEIRLRGRKDLCCLGWDCLSARATIEQSIFHDLFYWSGNSLGITYCLFNYTLNSNTGLAHISNYFFCSHFATSTSNK